MSSGGTATVMPLLKLIQSDALWLHEEEKFQTGHHAFCEGAAYSYLHTSAFFFLLLGTPRSLREGSLCLPLGTPASPFDDQVAGSERPQASMFPKRICSFF
jgi:hypothetical protein